MTLFVAERGRMAINAGVKWVEGLVPEGSCPYAHLASQKMSG